MIAIVSNGGQLSRLIAVQLLARGSQKEAMVLVDRKVATDVHDSVKGIATRLIEQPSCDDFRQAFNAVKTLVLIPNAGDVEQGISEHNCILAAAKESGVQRIILLSLSCAQTDSQVMVTPFLLYTENALRNSGLEWLILRRSLFIDSLAKWVQQSHPTETLHYPATDGRCSYVSKANIAAAVAAACHRHFRNEVFDLTGPSAISVNELTNALERCNNRQLALEITSDDDFIRRIQSNGVTKSKAEIFLSFFHGINSGEFARATDHVEKLTGKSAESVLTALRRLDSDASALSE